MAAVSPALPLRVATLTADYFVARFGRGTRLDLQRDVAYSTVMLTTRLMQTTEPDPGPIDWDQPDEVRGWIEETARKRPFRPLFFQAFADQVAEYLLPAGRILELGSGPGMLAEAILANELVMSYSLLDFSAPMHALARERLEQYDYKLHFLQRDFRESDWSEGLGPFDMIVTMQAVHEVRHKRHVPDLLDHVYSLLPLDGCFLYADHFFDIDERPNDALFMTRDEQYDVLIQAGFGRVDLVMEEGGMAMYRAVKE